MSGKFGIVTLVSMVAVIGRSATVYDKAFADGPQPTDFQYLPEAYAAVSPLIGMKYGELLSEVKDLQPDETQQLADAFKKEFDLQSDATEEIIEEGVELLLNGAALIKNQVTLFIGFFDKVKAFQARFA